MYGLLPEANQTIQLRDGRQLGYAEYGDPAGKPVFYAHGSPGSRFCHHPDESIAVSLGARIIVMDRPGYGLSDFQPGRKLLDWPDDVVQLADALGIDRFAIYGFSGGGPHAAACAYKTPHRLTKAAIINCPCAPGVPSGHKGMEGFNRLRCSLARYAPWPVWSLLTWLYYRTAHRNPKRFFEQMVAKLPDPDRAVITRPELKEMMVENCSEAFRAGTRGHSWDAAIVARPWGFRPEEIAMEVHLWHGEENRRIPLHLGQFLARAIRNCQATFVPDQGHYVVFSHWKEILAVLVC